MFRIELTYHISKVNMTPHLLYSLTILKDDIFFST